MKFVLGLCLALCAFSLQAAPPQVTVSIFPGVSPAPPFLFAPSVIVEIEKAEPGKLFLVTVVYKDAAGVPGAQSRLVTPENGSGQAWFTVGGNGVSQATAIVQPYAPDGPALSAQAGN